MSALALHPTATGVAFSVKVVPGSRRTTLAGLWEDKLKVKVAAAPEKGKANEALIAFLARRLEVKPRAVAIVSGRTNPVKQIEVSGLTDSELRRRLGLAE